MGATLAVQLASAIVTVLSLSAIAERVKPRISGLLAGMPIGSVLVYFFTGHERGASYIVASVPHGLASFTGTLVFVMVYVYAGRRWLSLGTTASLGLGVLAFFAVSIVLVMIPFTLLTGAVLTILVAACCGWLFRRIDFVRASQPVKLSFGLLVIRSILAAAFVAVAIAIATALNARWAGIMVGFPMTMLPTIAILARAYDVPVIHGFLRNFPFGMGSIIVFLASIPMTLPSVGVNLGIASSLAMSFLYTAAAMWLSHRRSRRP